MELLAAALGQIVGTSLSPELWGAVALAVIMGRTFPKLLLWAAAGAVAVIALRLTFVRGDAVVRMVGAVLGAVYLWSILIYAVRALAARRRAARASVPI